MYCESQYSFKLCSNEIISQWLRVTHFDIVITARRGALQLERVEGQVDSSVDWHLNGPQAVHPWLIVSIQVWIWRTKHAQWHGQVATTSLCCTCRPLSNKHLTLFLISSTASTSGKTMLLY